MRCLTASSPWRATSSGNARGRQIREPGRVATDARESRPPRRRTLRRPRRWPAAGLWAAGRCPRSGRAWAPWPGPRPVGQPRWPRPSPTAIRPGAMEAVQLLADSRSMIRPAVDGATSSAAARSVVRCDPGRPTRAASGAERWWCARRATRRRHADRDRRPARGRHGVHDSRFHQRLRLLCSWQCSLMNIEILL